MAQDSHSRHAQLACARFSAGVPAPRIKTVLHSTVRCAVSFALLIPLVLYVIYYRVFVLRELRVLDQAKQRAGVKGRVSLPYPSSRHHMRRPCLHACMALGCMQRVFPGCCGRLRLALPPAAADRVLAPHAGHSRHLVLQRLVLLWCAPLWAPVEAPASPTCAPQC